VARGNGNAIFNNTNTFNDSLASVTSLQGYGVLLSSGNVGIGADSVSSVPPTIDASPVGTGILGIHVGAEGGTCSLFASGGAHSIANKVAYTSASNTVTLVLGGSNNLTFAGEFDLVNAGEAAGTNRTLQVDNTAATTFSGLVTDNGVTGGGGIIKTGNGTLYLNGADNYTGPTTISAGVLAGSGSITSPVTVQTNGAIGGGSAAGIGTLTVNSDLTLQGKVFIRINKALSPGQSNDVVSVSGALSNTGTGTITVTNIGGTAVAVGDAFQIFNKAVTGGNTMTVTGAGMSWTNKLATDGSIVALSVASTVATNSTNITFSVSGGSLSLSWPADHLGWYLQMQTNGLRSTNWVDVAGSSTVTNVVIPVNSKIPTVFYRMSLQP
jgi:autotransporter-associated beta strand protein